MSHDYFRFEFDAGVDPFRRRFFDFLQKSFEANLTRTKPPSLLRLRTATDMHAIG